jgi:SAM-dependent methyltransferase
MVSDFSNVYDDPKRADAYATLEFPGTYYLAFRDLPDLIARHVQGSSALDFGCGAGRSTRFLRGLGFEAVGVDVAAEMIARARERDPNGDYRMVSRGRLDAVADTTFDLVLCAFTFDNILNEEKPELFGALGQHLAPEGRIINLVSAPEIYTHEWASFSTRQFPGNQLARSGERVLIEMCDVDDRRPVQDILCTDADYRDIFRRANLEPVETHRPLGRATEPQAWITETVLSPWVVYVLQPRVAPHVGCEN